MNAYTHELKTDHEPFEAILSGEKTHEIRYDDRGFKVGDTLVLRETRYSRGEMFAEGRPLEYTGRTAERVVTHIQRGYGLPRSMVVMSLAAPSASIADTARAFDKALRETYGMVDALNPPPAGSYYRGQHEGIIAALKTIRENFERIAATPASSVADEQQRADWIDQNVSGNPALIQAMKNIAGVPSVADAEKQHG